MIETLYLIAVAVLAIGILLVTVMALKWPAFLSLLFVSVLTALATGIPVEEIIPLVIEGMGGTLGSVALLVGLGAMLGGIIEKTGGAGIIAHRAREILGERRLGPALMIASGLVAIPIFFDVAFIILVPIVFSFAKAAGHRSAIALGVPVAVFMVFIHNAVPPHPGIVGSTTLLGVENLGMVTILGILLCIPMGFLAYALAGVIMRGRTFSVPAEIQQRFDEAGSVQLAAVNTGEGAVATSGGGRAEGAAASAGGRPVRQPAAWMVTTMILLPILMIAAGTVGRLLLEEGGTLYRVLGLIGAPGFALLTATLLAMVVLGLGHGWSREDLTGVMEGALGPAAIVVFVTGAGGVFARVLTESGIGDAVSGLLVQMGVPLLLLAFLLALIFKVAQGSGTVATLTAAGLVQSSVLAGDYSGLQVSLIVLAIAMGSVCLSHINDSGFWIATRFIGLDVAGGLRTWTVLCTILGVTGMAIISAAWIIVS